jgi:hypothetical protein
MKLSEFKKLIREEVRKVIKESDRNVMSEAATLDPAKKYYWFEYYPHQSGTMKAEVAITGKTLMSLKKLFDAGEDAAFDKMLATASKNKKFYFEYEFFDEFWKQITKALAAGKVFGDMTEEGTFAISPNSMEEAKKKVKKIEADNMDF